MEQSTPPGIFNRNVKQKQFEKKAIGYTGELISSIIKHLSISQKIRDGTYRWFTVEMMPGERVRKEKKKFDQDGSERAS